MKLQLESYKKKYTVETEYDDLGIDDYFEYFKGLLISSGWHQSTIDEYIIELANELKEE
jgi:hypothetical protein